MNFLLLFSLNLLAQKKILVLHSYHQGFEWTDNITKGIGNVLNSKNNDYRITYEYLDSKRNFSDEYFNHLAKLHQNKLKNTKYDLIIVSDNNALSFLNNSLYPIINDIPVVFCGINNYSEELTSNIKHYTGVIEEPDAESNIKLILTLHPDIEKILIINDKTSTGKAIRKDLLKIIPKYENQVKFEFLENFLLEEISNDLLKYGDETVIYLLSLNRDSAKKYISYSYGIILIEQSTDIPIYGSGGFYLDKGIVGGKLIKGEKQGEIAAGLAKDILEGKPINRIPIVKEVNYNWSFDYKKVQEYNIKTELLPENSIIINEPQTFLLEYLTYVIIIASLLLNITIFLITRMIISKRNQNYLIRLNKELDRKVRERTKSLEETFAELKKEIEEHKNTEKHLIALRNRLLEVNTSKDRFFSIIAHDLKSPFFSLIGFSEILLSETDELSKKEIKEIATEMNKALKNVHALLEDLLTWSRSQRGVLKVKKEKLQLSETVAHGISLLNKAASDKNITVKLDINTNEMIFVDRFMLNTIMRNLVSNAIKFTPANGEISITSRRTDGYVEISVTDNGVGIEEESKEKLFRIDQNLTKPGTKNEVGTGLGLVICSEFVKKHNGEIWIENNNPQGTIIKFTLEQ